MEPVSKVFSSIGLSDKEVRVYSYLIKKGATKAREISRALNIERVQLYRILKELQKRGMVETSFGYPTLFNAVSFGKVLDLIVKVKREEAENLESSKNDLMSQLDSYQPETGDAISDKFMVVEGRNYIYSKIAQMVQETRKTLAIVTSGVGVVQAYRSGLFEYAFDHNLKDDVLFRFLTNLSIIDNYVEAIKELIQRAQQRSLCFESRIGDFGAGYFPRFIVRDGVELLLFLRMDEDKDTDVLDTGLWTSNKVLVHAFIAFFEGMWQNSMNIEEAMKEYEKT